MKAEQRDSDKNRTAAKWPPTNFPMPRFLQPRPPRRRYLLDAIPSTGNVLHRIPWNSRAVEIANLRESNRRRHAAAQQFSISEAV